MFPCEQGGMVGDYAAGGEQKEATDGHQRGEPGSEEHRRGGNG